MFLNHSKWLRIALEASKFQKKSGGLTAPPLPQLLRCFPYTIYVLTYKPLVWLGLIVCFQQCYDLLYDNIFFVGIKRKLVIYKDTTKTIYLVHHLHHL